MKAGKKKFIRGALAGAILAASSAFTAPVNADTPGLNCDEARCVITIYEGLAFEAGVDETSEYEDRIELVGDVVVRTPIGDLDLLDAELIFEERPDLPDVAFELYGTAQAPLPALPLLADAEFKAQPLAAVGLVTRDTLKDLLENDEYALPLAENPVDPKGDPNQLVEPAYLLFHFETGLSFDMPLGEMLGFNQDEDAHDPFSFDVPGDTSVTFILDPAEPYFFLSQSGRELALEKLDQARESATRANERRKEAKKQKEELENGGDTDSDKGDNGSDSGKEKPKDDDKDKPKDDDGGAGIEVGDIAFSWLGGIPFSPQTTWGIPSDVGEFKGHLYIDTTIPLYKFVELNGEIVTHISKDGFEQGGNGDVDVGFSLGIMNFSFPLGNASAGVKLKNDQQLTYFSGVAQPDISFLPPIIPVLPQGAVMVAGYIDSKNLEDTRMQALGEFNYDMSGFEKLIGVQLNDIQIAKAYMTIDRNGVRITGSSSASIHPSVKLGGELKVDVYFSPAQPQNSYITMRGEMDIGGIGLQPALLSVSSAGLLVDGKFVTPISEIGVTGSITKNGPMLAGNASVMFPLGPITQAIREIRKDVIAAQDEVDRLDGVIKHQRSVVQGERDRDAKKVADARRKVGAAQGQVNKLNSSIRWHYSKIASYNRSISKKYRWYKRQKWPKKAWAWGKYTAHKAWANAKKGYHYSAIGGLKVALKAAQLALDVAKEFLRGVQATIVITPIDLDPRVSGPIAAHEIASNVLKLAEAALPPLPQIDADFRGDIDLVVDIKGARGAVTAKVGNQTLTKGHVNLGKNPSACVDVLSIGEVCAPF